MISKNLSDRSLSLVWRKEEETLGLAALGLKSAASELFVTVVIATSLASEPVLQAPDSRERRAVGEDRFGKGGGRL